MYGRALVNPALEPPGIKLIHAAPSYVDEYLRLLSPQVCFGCLYNCVATTSHWLDMRLPNHDLPALRQALALLERENTQVHQKLNLIQTVERTIARDLSLGGQIERISAEPNMSSRTLWRRLAEHRLAFEALLEQTRRGWTTSLPSNSGMSIEHVIEEVGCRDIRSLRRALKR